jgi:hypothetical protein
MDRVRRQVNHLQLTKITKASAHMNSQRGHSGGVNIRTEIGKTMIGHQPRQVDIIRVDSMNPIDLHRFDQTAAIPRCTELCTTWYRFFIWYCIVNAIDSHRSVE